MQQVNLSWIWWWTFFSSKFKGDSNLSELAQSSAKREICLTVLDVQDHPQTGLHWQHMSKTSKLKDHQHCKSFQIPASGINHRKFALELPTIPLVTFKVCVGWRASHLISSSLPITISISPSKVKKKLVKVQVHVAEFGCGTGWLAVSHSLIQWLTETSKSETESDFDASCKELHFGLSSECWTFCLLKMV